MTIYKIWTKSYRPKSITSGHYKSQGEIFLSFFLKMLTDGEFRMPDGIFLWFYSIKTDRA